MSKYREPSAPHDVSFKEIECVKKLLKTKKLTDKQKEAVESLLEYYFSRGTPLSNDQERDFAYTSDDYKKILKQYKEKPTLINEISSVEEAKWLDEALDAAIKALEQKPCNNAIDRQAVLDVINFEDKWLFDAKSHNEDTKIAFSAMKSQITKMPPV